MEVKEMEVLTSLMPLVEAATKNKASHGGFFQTIGISQARS